MKRWISSWALNVDETTVVLLLLSAGAFFMVGNILVLALSLKVYTEIVKYRILDPKQ